MKHEAKTQLIKDLIFALIAWVVGAVLFIGMAETGVVLGIVAGLFVSGVPFGWRWLSKIVTAVSFQGICMKLLGALFLGFIAIFVVIIGDIIRYKTADEF